MNICRIFDIQMNTAYRLRRLMCQYSLSGTEPSTAPAYISRSASTSSGRRLSYASTLSTRATATPSPALKIIVSPGDTFRAGCRFIDSLLSHVLEPSIILSAMCFLINAMWIAILYFTMPRALRQCYPSTSPLPLGFKRIGARHGTP